jgi:predicted TIM-barrel fold metal-dependent hydrolase
MIIDAHCHIFPRIGAETSSDDPALCRKLWQYHCRGARLRRKSDGAAVDRPRLDFEGDDLGCMPDVSFHFAAHGRAEMVIDGVEYFVQLYPPCLADWAAPAEMMTAEMDIAGVDMGVLQHDHLYGSLNEYYGDAMRRFPRRFIGLAQIHEWKADRPEEHELLRRAVSELGNRGLYFSVEPFALGNYADHLDDAKLEPLWNVVRELGISVWFYLHSRRSNRFAAYMTHVAELDRWSAAHPDIPAVWTHGLDIGFFKKSDQTCRLPDQVLSILRRPHMSFEWLGQAFWPEYPWVGAQEMIRQLREELGGVQKMLWGTDNPYAGTYWCTYRQAIDYIRLHCDFLSREEKDLILGGNAARLFGIQ